jgi:hypothetical protein
VRRAKLKALAEAPPLPAHTLATYFEAQTLILSTLARDVQSAWLELLALLEARGVLVVGQVPPAAVCRMEDAVRALTKGPPQ